MKQFCPSFDPSVSAAPHLGRARMLLRIYAWFLLKNLIGWLLILASLVLGPTIPGPGGIPLFLMGFALVSFPGKRRMTARVLRGRRFRRPTWSYSLAALAVSLLLPAVGAIMMLWLTEPRMWLARHVADPDAVTLELYLSLALLLWLLLRLAPRGANLLLPWMPRIRRTTRPWLRRRGVRLLPPRTRHRDEQGRVHYSENILAVTDEFHAGLARFWRRYCHWLLVLAAAAGVAAGFWMWRLF